MSKNVENSVIALLLGAAIGAGVGILFAPDKGSKTREKIKDGFDDAKHNLQDRLHGTKVNLEDSYEEIVSKMSHKTEDVITFLETKLAELKAKNAKLQK